MKSSRLILFVLILSAVAIADTIPVDPQVIISSGTGTTFLTQPIFNFSLSDPAVCTVVATGWDCPFMNVSGTPWTTLELFISPPQAPLSCLALSFFGSCQIDPSGGFSVTFLNGSIPSGVCEIEDFHVGEDDGEDDCVGQEFVLHFSSEFNPNTGVQGNANVPEPATLALLGSGIVGLIARRKRMS